jgi:hypothetical protein
MTQRPPAAPFPSALSPHDRRRIAVSASCHPECVEKYLDGRALRSTTIDRIEKALRNHNFERLIDARRLLDAPPR